MRSGEITSRNLSASSSRFRWGDPWILWPTCILIAFGLVMLFSASYIYADERTGDGFYFLKRQSLYLLMGVATYFAGLKLSLEKIERYIYPLLATSFVFLLLTFAPGLGRSVGGASRWIHLGVVNFQPAEWIKLLMVFFVARQLAVKHLKLKRFVPGVLGPLLIPTVFFGVLLLQPDFGSVALIGAVAILLMFIGGVNPLNLGGTVIAGLSAVVGLVLSSPYRIARVKTFFDPWSDPQGSGFQVLQSMVGFHHGGALGVGLGNGKEKLFFLPEAHNDFIFSVIGEELGLIGVLIVALSFGLLLFRGFSIGNQLLARGLRFQGLVAFGLSLLIALQATINMSVALGLLPTKGITLPLISYGGSSLMMNLMLIGFLQQLSKRVSV